MSERQNSPSLIRTEMQWDKRGFSWKGGYCHSVILCAHHFRFVMFPNGIFKIRLPLYILSLKLIFIFKRSLLNKGSWHSTGVEHNAPHPKYIFVSYSIWTRSRHCNICKIGNQHTQNNILVYINTYFNLKTSTFFYVKSLFYFPLLKM